MAYKLPYGSRMEQRSALKMEYLDKVNQKISGEDGGGSGDVKKTEEMMGHDDKDVKKAEKAAENLQYFKDYKRQVQRGTGDADKASISFSTSNVTNPFFSQAIESTGRGITGFDYFTNPNSMGYEGFYKPRLTNDPNYDWRYDYSPKFVDAESGKGESGVNPAMNRPNDPSFGGFWDSGSKISMFKGKTASANFNLPLWKSDPYKKFGRRYGPGISNVSVGLKGGGTIGQTIGRSKAEYISEWDGKPIGLDPNFKYLKPGTGVFNKTGFGATGNIGLSGSASIAPSLIPGGGFGDFKANIGAGVTGSSLGDRKFAPYGEFGVTKTLFDSDRFKALTGRKINNPTSFGLDAYFNKRQTINPRTQKVQALTTGQSSREIGLDAYFKRKNLQFGVNINKNTQNSQGVTGGFKIKKMF